MDDQFLHGGGQVRGTQAHLDELFLARGVGDELVRQANAVNVSGVEAAPCRELERVHTIIQNTENLKYLRGLALMSASSRRNCTMASAAS